MSKLKTYLIGVGLPVLFVGITAFSVLYLNHHKVFGAPAVFISTPATTSATALQNFSFTIGTTTPRGIFGSSTLAVYGSTTIQTWANTIHGFEVFNSATNTVFRVDTLNNLASTSSFVISNLISCDTIDTTATGALICGSDATGGGGGTGSNWSFFSPLGPIQPSTTVGVLLRASSTAISNFHVQGLFNASSSAIIGASSTIQGVVNVGGDGATSTFNSGISTVGGAGLASTGGLTVTGGGILSKDGLQVTNSAGRVLIQDGQSVSLPGLAFSGDQDVGLWRSGVNVLSLVANGAQLLIVGPSVEVNGADLLMDTGQAINFNSGNFTLTHTPGAIIASGHISASTSISVAASSTFTNPINVGNVAATSTFNSGIHSVAGLSTLGGLTISAGALRLNNEAFTDLTGTGLDNTNGVLTPNCAAITGSADLCDGSDATGGAGGNIDNVTYTTINGTRYYQASSTASDNLSWRFNNGFISAASSTFTGNLQANSIFASSSAIINGSSTIQNVLNVGDGGGEATSTFNSGIYSGRSIRSANGIQGSSLKITGLASALTQTDSLGNFANYAGTSCSNQFVRSLSALGAATCATVGTADVSGLDVSDDTNLAATLPLVFTASNDTLTLQGSIFDFTPITVNSVIVSATTSPLYLLHPSASTTASWGLESIKAVGIGARATTTILGDGGTSTFRQGILLNNLEATSSVKTSALTVTGLTSALINTDTGGNTLEYTGTSCTNQFIRSLDAVGAATCATVSAGDVSLANLTATDGTLTFSGTYNGSTARTIGLNLGNANTWTALQNFQSALISQASSTFTQDLRIAGNLSASSSISVSASSTFTNGINIGGALNITKGQSFIINGQSFTNLLGSGLLNTGGVLTPDCATITGGAGLCDGVDATGGGSGIPNLVYSSSTISNGIFYTASSTMGDNLAWFFRKGFMSGASSSIASDLDISSTSAATIRLTDTDVLGKTNAKRIEISNNNGILYIGTSSDTNLNSTTTALSFNPEPRTAVLGIGTSSPFADLSIHAQDGDTNITLFAVGSSTRTATTTHLRLLNTGQLYLPNLTNVNTGDYVCYNTSTFEITQSGTACSLSSIRYKENIRELKYGITEILALHPILYDLKPQFGIVKNQPGFIAEEAIKIVPNLVPLDKDGQPSNFDYPKFTAVITKAIQEFYQLFQNLVARVSGLEEKVNQQQQEIEILKARLDKLEK